MLQRALPNADRWTGFLEIFDLAQCNRCPDQPRNKSEHILFHCSAARPVWNTIDRWLEAQEPAGSPRIDQEAALLGIRSVGPLGVVFKERQWWPVLWLATLFEIWKGWTGYAYGGKPQPHLDVTLCAIWER